MREIARHAVRITAVAAVTAVTLATAGTGAFATATGARATCVGQWIVVPSPSPGTVGNSLFGVDMLSGREGWAVGSTISAPGDVFTNRPLALHWNGLSWKQTPTPGGFRGQLGGVLELSSTDVWAVGYVTQGLLESTPLVEHFDGTSWTLVPVPQIQYANLLAISGTSDSDLWAVGTLRGMHPHGLAMHYDGSTWTVAKTPYVNSQFVSVEGVASISPTDVWAVGYDLAGIDVNAPLTLHFDGTAWRNVSVPAPAGGAELDDVAAVNGQNVWAVGHRAGAAGDRPVAIQWNGTRWTIPADPAGAASSFTGIAAGPRGVMVAVGSRIDAEGNRHTLTEYYRDQSWTVVPSADVGTDSTLSAVDVVTGGAQSWAVGNHDQTSVGQTLVERYCAA